MNNEQSSFQSVMLMGGGGRGLPTQALGHCPKPSQKGAGGIRTDY